MTNSIDGHIGQRLRQRRWMLGLTQTQVGDRVGIKFQQIQKYETGQNRISAARLWDLARSLDVPVAYFYEGLEPVGRASRPERVGPIDGAVSGDPLCDRETIELARSFVALPPAARAKLVEFLRALEPTVDAPVRPREAAEARRHAS